MKKEICLITKKCHFLWWKWTKTYYEHHWKYKNKGERVCSNCGIKQVFFGFHYSNGHTTEDWREKI